MYLRAIHADPGGGDRLARSGGAGRKVDFLAFEFVQGTCSVATGVQGGRVVITTLDFIASLDAYVHGLDA